MQDWIRRLFEDPNLTRMGHGQRVEDLNLGLGWVYYGLVRAMRPKRGVVIGSYRGFVPLVIAKAMADNAEGGELTFVDPSFVDDFWKDPAAVKAHFASYGLDNVRHFLMTTQAFVESPAYRDLGELGVVFIDGHHSVEQARFDFEAFEPKLAEDGIVLFHDTRHYRLSRMHGPERTYRHDVKDYVDSLKGRADLQVLDLPYADGVSMVRKAGPGIGGEVSRT